MSFEIWLTLAAIYLTVTVPLAATAQWAERHLARMR
jgi:ABC-type amino acid transport system permease subunit